MAAGQAEPALQVLFDACRADAACDRHYPDLRTTFYGLVARLNAAPLSLRLSGGPTFGMDEIRMTGGRFGFLIWQSLYYAEAIPHLPRVIAEAATGSYERLARLIERERQPDDRSEGMQQSVECAEMAPFMTLDQLRAAAQDISRDLRQAALDEFGDVFARCRIWNVPAAAPRQKVPLHSDTPVLLLSGAFDPATPPASARLAAATLTHANVYVFPDSGHGVFRTNACAREVIAAFLATPWLSPRTSCVDRHTGPAFVLPDGRSRVFGTLPHGELRRRVAVRRGHSLASRHRIRIEFGGGRAWS